MIIHYRASGKDRKRLAQVIAKEIGVDAKYEGAPSFSYKMDYFTVDRTGALIFDDEFYGDEAERVLNKIEKEGFTPDEGDNDMEEKSGLVIQMPMMTGDEISRLEALIESKESLIKKAIGADSLAVGEKDGKLDFPWFKADAEPDEIIAYTPHGSGQMLIRTRLRHTWTLLQPFAKRQKKPQGLQGKISRSRMRSMHSAASCSGLDSLVMSIRRAERSCSGT